MSYRENRGSMALDAYMTNVAGVRELAKILEITPSYLSMLRQGFRLPSRKLANRICKVVGIPPHLWDRDA